MVMMETALEFLQDCDNAGRLISKRLAPAAPFEGRGVPPQSFHGSWKVLFCFVLFSELGGAPPALDEPDERPSAEHPQGLEHHGTEGSPEKRGVGVALLLRAAGASSTRAPLRPWQPVTENSSHRSASQELSPG